MVLGLLDATRDLPAPPAARQAVEIRPEPEHVP
jgi:hypothetical protein